MTSSKSFSILSGGLGVLRSWIRKVVPQKLLEVRARSAEARQHLKYSNLPVDRVFAEIYKNKEWGEDLGAYYSGTGSHDPAIITPYVDAVRGLLASFTTKPVVIDVGSGDFNVGRNFVELTQRYYACDIVDELQGHNRKNFNFPNVEFLCLNAVEDDLPDADIIFVRQVFQHLSNAQIQKILSKCGKYRRWVITEHLPNVSEFIPNKDITAGCGIRVLFNSGVVLTAPPFDITGYSVRVLCEVPEHGGVIRTLLFDRAQPTDMAAS